MTSTEKSARKESLLEDLRQHKRVSVAWDARVRYDEKEADCQILDASLSGVGIQVEGEIKPGVTVELDIPDIGTLVDRVVWSISGRVGIHLNWNPDTIQPCFLPGRD